MVFLNGQFIEQQKAFISVMDRGFLFADGVYEVIPVYNSKIFKVNEHLERLEKNLKELNITISYSKDEIIAIIQKLIKKNNFKHQSIYLQITRGADKDRKHSFQKQLTPTIFIKSSELLPYPFDYLKQGHHCLTQRDIRWGRCDIKSTSLLANVLYAQSAKEQQVEEIILVRDDIITEGASSNVFIIKNNTLITHPENKHILSGITRKTVLEIAESINLKVKEKTFTKDELYNADEVFIRYQQIKKL
ncbi:D-alanine aminotransferase [hydrothermal vent metagenome]|uniref:D-alanine aminotransferase n=1 Tax=hydrothermal vent metagenome TaxID=652676 RepID=A0A1W1CDY3_9ZZZZ